jgi:hypothetical protein
MENVYRMRIGRPIALHVAYGQMRVLLRGTLVAERPGLLRLRTADRLDVDISKSRVLAIEEDAPVCSTAHVGK